MIVREKPVKFSVPVCLSNDFIAFISILLSIVTRDLDRKPRLKPTDHLPPFTKNCLRSPLLNLRPFFSMFLSHFLSLVLVI